MVELKFDIQFDVDGKVRFVLYVVHGIKEIHSRMGLIELTINDRD